MNTGPGDERPRIVVGFRDTTDVTSRPMSGKPVEPTSARISHDAHAVEFANVILARKESRSAADQGHARDHSQRRPHLLPAGQITS